MRKVNSNDRKGVISCNKGHVKRGDFPCNLLHGGISLQHVTWGNFPTKVQMPCYTGQFSLQLATVMMRVETLRLHRGSGVVSPKGRGVAMVEYTQISQAKLKLKILTCKVPSNWFQSTYIACSTYADSEASPTICSRYANLNHYCNELYTTIFLTLFSFVSWDA